tara:strand:- start:754 stop:867 length:114 start_codon:yes stop_codon:yes gene_type:complete
MSISKESVNQKFVRLAFSFEIHPKFKFQQVILLQANS